MTAPVLHKLTRFRLVTILLSLVLVLAVGVLDYMTGHDITVTSFYLLPICWTGWVSGRRAGLLMAVISAAVWLLADMMGGYSHSSAAHRVIPYWNALMLLVIFAVVVYLLTAFHDVHAHLEDTVAQRTQMLRNEMAARKRLEAAKLQSERLAVVGSMAAKLAHEIRNPLGTVKLNLDLLGDEVGQLGPGSSVSTDEAKALLKAVNSEIRRMERLAEDYLQFSRLPKLNRKPIALNELLLRELEFLAPMLSAAQVGLTTDFDSTMPAIQADPDQLWQAVLNLIRNAMEAMPRTGTLTLRTANEDGEVALHVTDTGKGMNEEEWSQIFRPFFTTKPSGTGLGLTLVQQIIVEHGGRIECSSLAGRGTTFSIYFPIAAERAPGK